MAIGFGIASRNWWRAQIKGGVSPSFSLDFANIANDFTFTRSSFATRVNEFGLIETVSSDVPRIDYTNGEGAFLLEPQSTNLITYSEDFSQSVWIKYGVLIEDGHTAPDGSNTAYKVTENGSQAHLVILGGSISPENKHKSIWARTVSGTGTIQLLNHNTATGNIFTLTTQWQRFDLAHASLNHFYAVDFRGTSTLTEVVLWGAQLEELPYATSYIPTNGTAVTRSAETCTKNNLSTDGIFGGKEGTILLHVTDMAVVGTSLNLQTPFRLYRQVSDSYRFYYETDASFIGGNIDLSNKGGELKMAFSVSETDVKIYVNGSLHASYTYVNPLPSDLETWVWKTETKYKERVKDFKIYNKALTDDELIELTTI